MIRTAANSWAAAILDSLLPRHCLMCRSASGGENLCHLCTSELPRLGHACVQCGLPLSHSADRYCGHCLRKPPPWDNAIAAMVYGFPVDQLVRRFKFGRNLACGQVLAQELAMAVHLRSDVLPTSILPVPLHRWRHFTRAFNQADLLARQVGSALSIPVFDSILYRQRRTQAHSGLDAAARKRNIKGAFKARISAKIHAECKHVALIDDVMTTGATLAECTRVLKKSGVSCVSVWVAARALEPV
jgi:ComF family protein